jgi:hypothetical protein
MEGLDVLVLAGIVMTAVALLRVLNDHRVIQPRDLLLDVCGIDCGRDE